MKLYFGVCQSAQSQEQTRISELQAVWSWAKTNARTHVIIWNQNISARSLQHEYNEQKRVSPNTKSHWLLALSTRDSSPLTS
jgi:hypothetical protein